MLVLAALLGATYGMHQRANAAPVQTLTSGPAVVAPPAPEPVISWPAVGVTPAAPTTVRDYAALWASINPNEWAGADVSLSVPLADSRVVWLYGDTLSRGRGMVHSTGITQDGGRLHVSREGAQLLPNDEDGTVYWIEAARETSPGLLAVTAAPIRFGSTGRAWDFRRESHRSRVARVSVATNGDLTFKGWTGTVSAPASFDDLTVGAEGHVTYENRAHRWAELEDGRTLWTVNNNWTRGFRLTDSGTIDFPAYVPTFYSR